MKLNELYEGLFDRFKKQAKPTMLPITQEQRDFIKQYFSQSNADVRYGGPNSAYVLDTNVHANHGRGKISFRNEDGQLIAGVAFHASAEDRANPHASPLVHYDVPVNTPADMEKLIGDLE